MRESPRALAPRIHSLTYSLLELVRALLEEPWAAIYRGTQTQAASYFVCLSSYCTGLYFCLYVFLPICLPVCLPLCLCAICFCFSVFLFGCMPVSLFVCLSPYLAFCLPVSLSSNRRPFHGDLQAIKGTFRNSSILSSEERCFHRRRRRDFLSHTPTLPSRLPPTKPPETLREL